MNHANFAQGTLAAAVTTTDETSIIVTSEAGFPSTPFIISIDTEAMLVTTVDTVTWTVTRGYEGSTAAAHANGAVIFHDISAAEADSIAAKLALAGGTMSGVINMGNQDISYLKLLKLNGEINDGDSGTAKTIDWNMGTAHKSTLTGNITFAFMGYGMDVIPVMTNETMPSGRATASAYSGPDYPWQAFDSSETTRFTANNTTVWWLKYQFAATKTIVLYSIESTSAQCPTVWTFEGSDNNTDWTVLDTRTGQSWSAKERHYFTITTPRPFVYYRLNVTNANYNYAYIYDFEMMENAGTINPTSPCFLTLKLVQDATGGRTVTWPTTVKGSIAVASGANAVTIIHFYFDGTNYWPMSVASF